MLVNGPIFEVVRLMERLGGDGNFGGRKHNELLVVDK